jgi:hypothetical protein
MVDPVTWIVHQRRSRPLRSRAATFLAAWCFLALVMPVLAQGQTVISVPATVPWVDTGVDLREGDVFTVRCGGQWSFGGATSQQVSSRPRNRRNATLQNAPIGALIGRIGDVIFLVGRAYRGEAPSSGRLFLGMNVVSSMYSGNTGELQVTITNVSKSSYNASGPVNSASPSEPVVPKRRYGVAAPMNSASPSAPVVTKRRYGVAAPMNSASPSAPVVPKRRYGVAAPMNSASPSAPVVTKRRYGVSAPVYSASPSEQAPLVSGAENTPVPAARSTMPVSNGPHAVATATGRTIVPVTATATRTPRATPVARSVSKPTTPPRPPTVAPVSAAVPAVVGLIEANAAATIERSHLHAVRRGEEPSARGRGQVTRTDPVAGTTLKRGMPVGYWLATGENAGTVATVNSAVTITLGKRNGTWAFVLFVAGLLAAVLAATAIGLRMRLVKITRSLLRIRASLDSKSETNFPDHVQKAGPTAHLQAQLEMGEARFEADVPIVKREVCDD